MKSRHWSVRWLFWIGLVCALATPAYAQPADALKKAQAAFDQAQLDYLQGKYDEAAAGFESAFAARQFPQFLYNVGASWHMKGKKASDSDAYTKAVDAYRRYLAADPQASDKAKVEKAIGVLEAEIKRLIDAENDILSDDTLVELLKGKGFDLARRTVAKYREAIGIGSSIKRRRQRKMTGG